MKNILFIGTTRLSLELLKNLHSHSELKITGIVSGEENFRISYSKELVHNYNYRDLTVFANQNLIPSFKMSNGMKDRRLKHWISQRAFDYILVVGWYHMIPEDWIADYKCLGVHASLLPKYRGGAPLVWAMINGETETGVSLFLMDNGVDTGRVLAQNKILIEEQETIAKLLNKVEKETIQMCVENLPLIENSQLCTVDNSPILGIPYPQRRPEDGKIVFPISVDELSRFIRAQTRPYPGAYLEKGPKKLYLWEPFSRTKNLSAKGMGKVFINKNKIEVQCDDGTLSIAECSLIEGNTEIRNPKEIIHRWNN